eukprot:Opistho-1_new@61680
MRRCWEISTDARPTFGEIYNSVNSMLSTPSIVVEALERADAQSVVSGLHAPSVDNVSSGGLFAQFAHSARSRLGSIVPNFPTIRLGSNRDGNHARPALLHPDFGFTSAGVLAEGENGMIVNPLNASSVGLMDGPEYVTEPGDVKVFTIAVPTMAAEDTRRTSKNEYELAEMQEVDLNKSDGRRESVPRAHRDSVRKGTDSNRSSVHENSAGRDSLYRMSSQRESVRAGSDSTRASLSKSNDHRWSRTEGRGSVRTSTAAAPAEGAYDRIPSDGSSDEYANDGLGVEEAPYVNDDFMLPEEGPVLPDKGFAKARDGYDRLKHDRVRSLAAEEGKAPPANYAPERKRSEGSLSPDTDAALSPTEVKRKSSVPRQSPELKRQSSMSGAADAVSQHAHAHSPELKRMSSMTGFEGRLSGSQASAEVKRMSSQPELKRMSSTTVMNKRDSANDYDNFS